MAHLGLIRTSALVMPFGVGLGNGVVLFFGLNMKKSVFAQFLNRSNLKKFHFLLCLLLLISVREVRKITFYSYHINICGHRLGLTYSMQLIAYNYLFYQVTL